jgi:hypothetical protein
MIQITPQMRIVVAIEPAGNRVEGADLRWPRFLALPQAAFNGAFLLVAGVGHGVGQDAGGAPVARAALGRQSRSGAGGAGVAAGRPGGLTEKKT